jgi:adenosine deaminase
MTLETFIRAMPKVELHVHLEGSIRPATLLELARRHAVNLPVTSTAELHDWYRFVDFAHFAHVYTTISSCLRTPDDIELITREFLAGQAEQHVLYSEVTYTAIWIWATHGIPFGEQLAAVNRARAWANSALGVDMALILDIPRNMTLAAGEVVADWVIASLGDGVAALGLAGPEAARPPAAYHHIFDRARAAGVPSVPHAGEHAGPESIWSALRDLHADRIGHGVRCVEDLDLVTELRDRQVPLEVCPSSNVCLGVAPHWPGHPLQQLLDAGLYVTLNSDDPPMFDTTVTGEYLRAAATFGFGAEAMERLVLNAAHATLLPLAEREALVRRCRDEFIRLRPEHLP